MAINKELTQLVDSSISHTESIRRYQRAQEKMLMQIKLNAFDTSDIANVDEWLVSIDSTVSTLNKLAIAIDKNFEARQ